MSLLILLGALVAGDVDRLDAARWDVREDAQARLRAYGLAAVPALLAGTASESPEVRLRCNDLLSRWRRLAWNLDAVAVLTADRMPDELDYWFNERLRTHVLRMALAAGCVYCDFDLFGGCVITPAVNAMTPEEARWCLLAFRIQLGTQLPGWWERIAQKFRSKR